MNNLIALYSPAPQSGKSTIASRLQSHGYTIVSFAAPLKLMLQALLEYQDVDFESIYGVLHGGHKETPLDELGGRTSRHCLQKLGTEWGRGMVHDNLWVDVAKRRVIALLELGEKVVIDDMRFPNEFEMVREIEGLCAAVARPSAVESSGHASEGALDDNVFDVVIENTGTLEQLWGMAEMLSQVDTITPRRVFPYSDSTVGLSASDGRLPVRRKLQPDLFR